MFFYTRYRRELGAARRRVQSSGSSITLTRLGAIEQVTYGDGQPSARKSHSSYATTHEPHRLQGWRLGPNELN